MQFNIQTRKQIHVEKYKFVNKWLSIALFEKYSYQRDIHGIVSDSNHADPIQLILGDNDYPKRRSRIEIPKVKTLDLFHVTVERIIIQWAKFSKWTSPTITSSKSSSFQIHSSTLINQRRINYRVKWSIGLIHIQSLQLFV